MTEVLTTPAPAQGEPDEQPTLWQRYTRLPAWARWSTAAAAGILLLTVVQAIGTGDTDVLTDAGTAGGMLRFAVPIMLAGLGGLFAERAGVVNIGLEGMMILGTWFGAWGTVQFETPWAGLVTGLIGGALGGLLHAVATVTFNVDHIVSGVAINLLAPGLTRFLSDQMTIKTNEALQAGGEPTFPFKWEGGSITQSPRAAGLPKVDVPLLGGNDGLLSRLADQELFFVSDVADILDGAFTQISLFTVIAYALVPLSAWVLWKTRLGLRIRICGERPEAGESLGVNIYLHKYMGVITSGALAGLAGAFIAMELANVYREGQTTGRGFIGLAALIFGNWRPVGVMMGSLLFGYPFVLALRDGDQLGTRGLLLVVAIVLGGVLVKAIRERNRTDAIIAGILAGGALLW
ncbi:MAG: ABC transporter permease, partial [Actinomycetota bacterium]